MVARVAEIPAADDHDNQTEARFLQLKEQAIDAITLLPNVPDELIGVVRNIESAGLLADMVTHMIDIKPEQKQDILEAFDLAPRLDQVIELLAGRVEVLRLSKEIGDRTRAQFDERQRETVLREQLRQIQKELGDIDDSAAEVARLKETIDAAGMPDEVLSHARKELGRLQRMGEDKNGRASCRERVCQHG